MIDKLEAQNIVAKPNDIGVIIKYSNPCMLVKKLSLRELPTDSYNKMSDPEKLKYLRFVLCQNKLCQHVMKKPALSSRLEETIQEVGKHHYIIAGDLEDSFWQRQIVKDKLPYFGFHGPYGQDYVFLRSSQGFLNQSEELEQLVKVVLAKGIREGWCIVQADNIWVGGDTADEAILRWEETLEALERNNLKLKPKKTQCFPTSLDLLGWKKTGTHLIPDPHRQDTLVNAELPKTVTELRSYLGSYNTFHKCRDDLTELLSDLNKLCSTGMSKSAKIPWTDELIKKFRLSQQKAKDMEKLYIPQASDQLVLTQDYSGQGVSATLWAFPGDDPNKREVVAKMSAPLSTQQQKLLPCDGEVISSYIAAKSPIFSVPIKASKKKTISLVDNKPVTEAAKLLEKGKFSTSRIINFALTSISDLNLKYEHNSGKMGKNFADDFASRNPAKCGDPSNCSVCTFIAECSSASVSQITLSVSPSPSHNIIGSINRDSSNDVIQDIISGKVSLPFGNKKAMKFLQDQDPDICRVRELLKGGQQPSMKRDFAPVKTFFRADVNASVDREGCLVVTKTSRSFIGATRNLVVVPDSVSLGLLHSLHINLLCPTTSQLMKVVDSKFYIRDLANKVKSVTNSCSTCASLRSIPEEIHKFQTNEVPNHPGQQFTIDILRESKKIVMVSVCNFSGYMSTMFLPSEKTDDLLDGVVAVTTPFTSSSLQGRIRVDQAPGWQSLERQKEKLAAFGLDLELGDKKNKNSLAICDERMKELRKSLRVLVPKHGLNIRSLAQATKMTNERIRTNHNLSPKEILFSRDNSTGENIKMEDSDLAEKIEEVRKDKNEANFKTKQMNKKEAKPANASLGQLVLLKADGNKSKGRDIYMVIGVSQDNTLTICMMRDIFSSKSMVMEPHRYRYKIRQDDIVLAPNQPTPVATEPMPWLVQSVPPTPSLQPRQESPAAPSLANPYRNPYHPDTWYTEALDDDEDDDETILPLQHPVPQAVEPLFQPDDDAVDPLLHPDQAVDPLLPDIQPVDPLLHPAQVELDSDGLSVDDEEPLQEGDVSHFEQGQHDGEDPGEHNEAEEEEQMDHYEPEQGHEQPNDDDQNIEGAGAVEAEPEDQEDFIVIPQHLQPLQQQRQPRKDDVVCYYDEAAQDWLTVKITSAQTGFKNYYNFKNVQEPKELDGAYFLPPTDGSTYLWTIMEGARSKSGSRTGSVPREPAQQENLRHCQEADVSRQITPLPSPDNRLRDASTEGGRSTNHLQLSKDDLIAQGSVYYVPTDLDTEKDTVEMALSLAFPPWFAVPQSDAQQDLHRMNKWNQAYIDKYFSTVLERHQEYLRPGMASAFADAQDQERERRRQVLKSLNPLNLFKK